MLHNTNDLVSCVVCLSLLKFNNKIIAFNFVLLFPYAIINYWSNFLILMMDVKSEETTHI